MRIARTNDLKLIDSRKPARRPDGIFIKGIPLREGQTNKTHALCLSTFHISVLIILILLNIVLSQTSLNPQNGKNLKIQLATIGPGDELIYGILVFLSGIGFGATLAIPSAIQADVIDYDELLTGERREGQYIGLWSISKKFAAAVGIGIGLTVLGIAGYNPNTEQPAAVLTTLRVLYALVPSLCNLVAIAIAFAYPISSRIHVDIRDAIARRQKGLPVANPLKPAQTLG